MIDQISVLLAGSHNILNKWKTYSLKEHIYGQPCRHIDLCTSEQLVCGPTLFKAENAVKKLIRYKSPSIGQFPSENI
jgi:hypothetical protein